MKFKIPCAWTVLTIEEIEAKNLVDAQDKAFDLKRPRTLEGCKIEAPIGGGLDWKAFNKMYPPKPVVDPMKGWTVVRSPGPYDGGIWTINEKNGTEVTVMGDTGPVDVGIGLTTYSWRVSTKDSDVDLVSKGCYHKVEEARDAGLKEARRLGRI